MLKSITWGDYFLVTGILVVVWYTLIFFSRIVTRPRARMKVYSADKRPEVFSDNSGVVASDGTEVHEVGTGTVENDDLDWNLIVQTVMQEAKEIIFRASESGENVKEMSAELRVCLVNHQDLAETAYGGMITEFIIRETASRGYELDEESVVEFWK